VPPELEEMLRAQLAARSDRPAAAVGSEPAAAEPVEADKPKRRTTRKPAAAAGSEPAAAGSEPAASEPAAAEKPKRRTTRKPATTAG
jgi:hypothetical protein